MLKILALNCQRYDSWLLVPAHDWPLRRPVRAVHYQVLIPALGNSIGPL